MAMPKRVRERIISSIRKFIPVIKQQYSRGVSEADTVTLVKDIMAEAMGYDKYSELTGEFAIRGTYCDLAVVLGKKIRLLIEVKAIGKDLKDSHVRQAVDYAVKAKPDGVEWVVLTNGRTWRLYNVIFGQPVEKRLVFEIDMMNLDYRNELTLGMLYALTKEGFTKNAHVDLKDFHDATSRYLIGVLLSDSDSVISAIKRELKRVVDVKVSTEDIGRVLLKEIIKPEITVGQDWTDAKRLVKRKLKQAEKRKTTVRKKQKLDTTKPEDVTSKPDSESSQPAQM